MNLRNGRVVRSEAALPKDAASTSVRQVVLKGNNSVAWIGEAIAEGDARTPLMRTVSVSDSSGYSVLEEGLGIGPRSLALSGSELTWTVSGVNRAAVLR
jgi:hypothetical protein